MIHLSVLIPQRDAAEAVERQLPELLAVLEKLRRPYEVIVIDDGSAEPSRARLKNLLAQHASLRLLRLDPPSGTSAALTAGIAAARGQLVAALEPGDAYPADQIPELVRYLVRVDLVYGRRRREGWAKARHRLGRIPRWLLLGLEVRDPGWLFWAARKEAVAGLELARGMYRYLPTLVRLRGYRAGEIPVEARRGRRPSTDEWPNPADLLSVWWLRRRRRPFTTREIAVGNVPQDTGLKIGGTIPATEVARGRAA